MGISRGSADFSHYLTSFRQQNFKNLALSYPDISSHLKLTTYMRVRHFSKTQHDV